MDDGAAVAGFRVGDPIDFFNVVAPTDPDPAPGVVTAVSTADRGGAGEFSSRPVYAVEITLADGSTVTEEGVGIKDDGRRIQARDMNGGEL